MTRPGPHRPATLSLPLLMILSTALLAVLVGFLRWETRSTATRGAAPLRVYCAAALRHPLEEIVAQYEREYGVAAAVQYGGSNTLLSQIAVSRVGDVFLAADDAFVRRGQAQGLLAEAIPLATMYPVIAVRRGGPRRVSSLADLLRPDVRVACANPDAAGIGNTARTLLRRVGQWEALQAHIERAGVFKPTVNDVANDVQLGSVDAGIVWDTTVALYPELEAVRVAELDGAPARVEIAVLADSRCPAAARHFARYVGARDRGLRTFAAHHFTVVDGECWADAPEISCFGGSGSRRAFADIVTAAPPGDPQAKVETRGLHKNGLHEDMRSST